MIKVTAQGSTAAERPLLPGNLPKLLQRDRPVKRQILSVDICLCPPVCDFLSPCECVYAASVCVLVHYMYLSRSVLYKY